MLLAACLLGSHGGRKATVHGAEYRVPVPAALEPWAIYPVGPVKVSHQGGSLKIEYRFPTWLVGDDHKVKLVGHAAPGATSIHVDAGSLGEGDCTISGDHVTCVEHFPGMPIDRDAAEEAMIDEGFSAQEIEQRLEVTDAFSVDPIGILDFDMP
ncbi:Hypothetical protein A7982_06951 [Minicystis rosea]|nr:Hypothetical protein A7982_06951 [Minicystis rosea]